MTYSVYIDKKIVFNNLSKADAEQRVKELQQMICAGIPTQYTIKQIKILEIKL